jgi:hypothetical protein
MHHGGLSSAPRQSAGCSSNSPLLRRIRALDYPLTVWAGLRRSKEKIARDGKSTSRAERVRRKLGRPGADGGDDDLRPPTGARKQKLEVLLRRADHPGCALLGTLLKMANNCWRNAAHAVLKASSPSENTRRISPMGSTGSRAPSENEKQERDELLMTPRTSCRGAKLPLSIRKGKNRTLQCQNRNSGPFILARLIAGPSSEPGATANG